VFWPYAGGERAGRTVNSCPHLMDNVS
jgi:hypothetical protein